MGSLDMPVGTYRESVTCLHIGLIRHVGGGGGRRTGRRTAAI